MPSKPSRSHQYKFSGWTLLIGLAVVAAMVGANKFHLFDRYEYDVSDLRMYWHATPKTTGLIDIAAVDDKSIAELGQWPWPRSTMAQFERALIDYKVAVVGYDVLFSEQDNFDAARASLVDRLRKTGATQITADELIGQANDQAFADAIKAQGKTILAYSFGTLDAAGQTKGLIEQGFITDIVPPPPLEYNLALIAPRIVPKLYGSKWYRPPTQILNQAARSTGYVPIDSDEDGVMRAQIMVARFHDAYRVPLSLAVLKALAGDDASLKLSFRELGEQKIVIQTPAAETQFPVNEHGQMLINFRGPEGTFPHYSITDIINHRVPEADLAGKIVLIGETARGGGDRFNTPEGGDFPGVEIHANAIDDILQNDVIVRSSNNAVETMSGLVLGILMVLAASYFPASLTAFTAVSMAAGYLLLARQMLWHDHHLVGVVYPLLMLISSYLVMAGFRYYEENKDKRYLRHAFEHYLHPSIIAQLVDHPEQLKLGGDLRIVSILFADLVNYTGLSERSDPVALVTMLNDYMTQMTDRILDSGGVVDKIRGDGIMAFWGAPVDMPNHAQIAIDTALEMLSELKKLNASDPRFKNVDIGIGIATGEAIAGNFGGKNRFDYSVIGDTVNLASRLEELTRKFKCHLLVNRETVIKAVGGNYIKRDIGLVRVKGKQNAIEVVEVAGQANDGVDPEVYNRFAHLSELLQAGKDDAARAELVELQQQHPDDGVIHMYADRFAELKELPREMLFEFDTK
jgi:adenylate cyclase